MKSFNLFSRDQKEVEREQRENYTLREKNGSIYLVVADGCGGYMPIRRYDDLDTASDILGELEQVRDIAIEYYKKLKDITKN